MKSADYQKPKEKSLFSFSNLLKAYYACRKNKRRTASAADFAANLENNLFALERELKSRTYGPSPLTCFPVTEPKLREIWAADFRDRIVHHLLISYLEPIFEKKFIFHSYACRPRKGTHLAVINLRRACSSLTINLSRSSISGRKISRAPWYLQADIQSFFVSINKNILLSLINHTVKNPEIIWLAKKIIFKNPLADYRIRGNRRVLAAIPPAKSLFFAPLDRGLPIGNLTSQFFANVYLNELDQFIKHQLKCRYYFRYMDDFILLSPNLTELRFWRDQISSFLGSYLKLQLHPRKLTIQPIRNGLNFCGYIVRPDYNLIRRRTAQNLKNKLKQFNQKIAALYANDLILASDTLFANPFSLFSRPDFTLAINHIYIAINSTYGSLRWADCFSLRRSLYEHHFWFLQLYLKPANRNYDYFLFQEPSANEIKIPRHYRKRY